MKKHHMEVSIRGSTRKSSIFVWIFHCKPSSYWSTFILAKPPFELDLLFQKQSAEIGDWTPPCLDQFFKEGLNSFILPGKLQMGVS